MLRVHNVDTKKKCLNFGTPRTEELEETCLGLGVKKKGYEYYRWIKFGARTEKKKKTLFCRNLGPIIKYGMCDLSMTTSQWRN